MPLKALITKDVCILFTFSFEIMKPFCNFDVEHIYNTLNTILMEATLSYRIHSVLHAIQEERQTGGDTTTIEKLGHKLNDLINEAGDNLPELLANIG